MGLIEARRQARAVLADAVLTPFQVAALDALIAAAMSDAYDEGYAHGMCAKDVQDGNHAYAEYAVSRLGIIWLGAHWRCRRIHAAVDRAADVLAGSTDRRATLGVIVGTYVAGRHVWYPHDAAELVDAGLIADDGPVDNFPDRRWYRPVDKIRMRPDGRILPAEKSTR